MPFTFAHPAVVLPFGFIKKYKFSITGLIIGSMSPDFEYFIKMKGEREYGHSLAGIFWFDLPLSILIAFAFHLVVRNPLLNNLPYFLQRRFSNEKRFDWTKWFKKNTPFVILSFLIGIASHLFMDGFTNENGFFVRNIPFLKESIRTDYTSLYFNNLLSYVLSLVGCLVVVYAIFKQRIDRKAAVDKPTIGYWAFLLLVAVSVIILKTNAIENERMIKYWYLYISGYAIIALSSFMIGLGVTSLIFTLKEKAASA